MRNLTTKDGFPRIYLDTLVGVCGENQVYSCAQSIVSSADNDITSVESAFEQYLRGQH